MKNDKIEIYQAPDGWRWRYIAPNSKVLADGGQAYSRSYDAIKGARRVAGFGTRSGDVVVEVVR